MHCFVHERVSGVGLCSACQRAVCRECVARESPRLVCRACAERRQVIGFEYRSRAEIAGWPLVHVCLGADAVTLRPKIARGVIAIGNIAVGGIAIAGLSLGLVSIGGCAIGLLGALGGAALGLGVSFGGLAVGSLAFGGGALGLQYAIGGAAFGPAVIDGSQCDQAARELISAWLGTGSLPPSCH
jgi:hypothetical protein